MSSLGVYFGPKFISLTEVKGKKILNKAQIPLSAFAVADLEDEKVPLEVKMVAALKDSLRRAKIEADEAMLSLSGRDMLIRTFDMPGLPAEELANAVNFEAKRYIPFKVEDLRSDFQAEFDRSTRQNQVLFCGIKKELFDHYISIFNELNLKITSLEYSGFSILRAIKLAGLSDAGITAAISVDFREEDEVNFLVLENGFPLFSRDISIGGLPDEVAQAGGALDNSLYLEKIRNEVRLSLDYYNRKFPAKNIQKVSLICASELRKDLEGIISEAGLTPRFADYARITGRQDAYSLGSLKGYCASLPSVRTKVRLDLLTVKKAAATSREKMAPVDLSGLVKGLKINPNAIIAGLFICALTFGYGFYKINPLQKELASTIAARPEVPGINPAMTLDQLKSTSRETKRQLNALQDLIENQLFLTLPLDVIPRALSDGTWLTGFDFSKGQRGDSASLNLTGSVYLGDSDKEFATVNKFVANLKDNPEFSKYFKHIILLSVDRSEYDQLSITVFKIRCSSGTEGR